MDVFMEIVLELLVEGGIEVASNKKISNWVRYPVTFLILLFYLIIILGIIMIGILVFKNSILGGLFIISIGLALLILSIIKFSKSYIKIKNK